MKPFLFKIFFLFSIGSLAQQIWVVQNPQPFIQFTDLKCRGFSNAKSIVYNSHDLLRLCGSTLLRYDFDSAYWRELNIEITTYSVWSNIQLYSINDSITILHGRGMSEFILNGTHYTEHPQYKLLIYFNHIDKQLQVDTLNRESLITKAHSKIGNIQRFLNLVDANESEVYNGENIDIRGVSDIDEHGRFAFTNHFEKSGFSSINVNRLSIFDPRINVHTYLPHPIDSTHHSSELRFWKDYLILESNKKLYISDTSKIDWAVFSEHYSDFEVDLTYETLALLRDSTIDIYHSPSQKESFDITEVSPSYISKHVNLVPFTNKDHILLSCRNQQYALRDREFISVKNQALLSTIDKMQFSYEYPSFSSHYWTIEGQSIYHINNNEYLQVLEFSDRPNNLVEIDSTHLLVQFDNHDYLFDLDKTELSETIPRYPLSNFLKTGIDRIDLLYKESGCFHFFNVAVHLTNDQTNYEYATHEQDINASLNTGDSIPFYQVLSRWNSNPTAIPELKDFHISISDIKTYLSYYNEIEPSPTTIKHVQASLDTISQEYFETKLKSHPIIACTSSSKIKLVLTNNNGERIEIEYVDATCSIQSAPHLPWKLTYNSIEYMVYDPKLSEAILSMLNPYLDHKRMKAMRMNFSNANVIQSLLGES